MKNDATRNYFFIVTVIYLIAFGLGYFVPVQWKWNLLQKYASSFEAIQTMDDLNKFLYILYNNLGAALLTTLTGIFVGIGTIISVILNGYVAGSILQLASKKIGCKNSMLAFYPHGIFEIIAMLISASYGLWLGVILIRTFRQQNTIELKGILKKIFTIFIAILLPLLIVAAFLEVYVTPHLYTISPIVVP